MVRVPLSPRLTFVDALDALAATVERLPTSRQAPTTAVTFRLARERFVGAPLPLSPPPALRGPSILI
jgi:hypothetical protein